jgi:energy-coupling factor transport system ATP-binding protein
VHKTFVEVRDLRYVYHPDTPQAVVAIDGLTCSIEAGEYVAVVGGNGSGKSTFARHLNALLLPTSGEVRVAGLDTREAASAPLVRRHVGMVFQNPDNQLVATIVEDDVAFGPENLGLAPAEIRRRVDDALARVGMDAYRQRPPHLLSGGQKQRVAIAGVLAMRPQCIVLDEATTMLDPGGRDEVLATIRDLNRRDGITVVLITHSLDELADATRVLALDAGRIVADGTPADVIDRADTIPGGRLVRPVLAALARDLRADGVPVPRGAFTIEAVAEGIVAGFRAGRQPHA